MINPLEYSATAFVCLFGGYVMLRHHEGMAIRKSWAIVLLLWGSIELLMLVLRFGLHISAIGSTPDNPLYNATVTVGNILAWLLFIYPTQALRPGWLNWKRALLVSSPIVLLAGLDYIVDADLLPLIMIYPVILFLAICRHIREYRLWCEENYSSMERIDVQWIVRYLIILALLGLSFYFICFWYVPNRMFTQQWLILLMFAYSTEQILFRRDPWEGIKVESGELRDERNNRSNECEIRSRLVESDSVCQAAGRSVSDNGLSGSKRAGLLTRWMRETKPYLNPDFQLMDLRHVLPMNRTYLSRFIRDEFGCTFYQFVNKYRIEEAKRLMTEQPEMRLADVATRSGFSSREAFARTFTQVTGLSPREWEKECNNS